MTSIPASSPPSDEALRGVPSWESWPFRMGGAALLALGATVLVGWHTGDQTLIQVCAGWAAMKYNTALGFALLGGSLLLHGTGRSRIARAPALLVCLLGTITLFQYLAGVSVGIDTLLWAQDEGGARALYTGRMAPNTALAFTLAGLGAFWPRGRTGWRPQRGLAVLAAMVVALGVVPLLGYATGLATAHAWGPFIAMAVHTASGMVIAGTVLFLREVAAARARPSPYWHLPPIGLGLAVAVVFLWRALDADQGINARRALDASTEVVRDRVARELLGRTRALGRMAERWTSRGGTPPDEWERDARAYLRDYPGYLVVDLLDENGTIRRRVPNGPASAGPDSRFDIEQPQRAALAAARARGPAVVTLPLQLPAGRNLFLVCVPLLVGPSFQGAITAILRPQDMFDAFLSDTILGGHAVLLWEGDDLVYERTPGEKVGPLAHEVEIPVPGLALRMALAPTVVSSRALRSPVDKIALALGALMTGVTLAALYFAEKSRQRGQALAVQSAHLAASNEELERFAYLATHDLKSPLRGLANLAAWLEDDLRAHFSEDNRQQMGLLRGRIARLETFLDDISRYLRAGKGDAALEEVDVETLVRTVFTMPGERTSLTLELGSALPTFTTVKTALAYVFEALVGNAVKHHDGGQGRVRVSCVEKDLAYEFAVADDGPGVPKEYAGRIFEPFQTLKPRDAVEGSGVGLAIVKKLVEAADGRVWVEPSGLSGRGVTFFFVWPKRWPTARTARHDPIGT